jgi:serine/threonine-protein kinase
MDDERWHHVEQLYHRALEYPPDHRGAFLDHACGGDPGVRDEVESLLACDAPAAQCLATWADGMVAWRELSAAAHARPARIARGGGSAQRQQQYHRLLLYRLRIYCSLMGAAVAALTAWLLWNMYSAVRADVVEELGGASFFRSALLSLVIPLAVCTASALLLRWRPPATFATLRRMELLVTATLAGSILWGMIEPEWYGLMQRTSASDTLRELRAFRGAYVESTSLRWFGLLVGYGVLIPNTWRRCAAVVGAFAVAPLVVFATLGFWVRPIEADVAAGALMGLTLWLGIGAVFVVLTCYRIEVLGRQAAEARRLGQYRLKDRLGVGGMGEVYLAEHVLLRRPCAVKLISPERAGNPRLLRRFEREVRLTATLTHPNTVQVFDYGHTEDGTFYYVMEYLNGLTLEEIVRRHGPVPPARAVYLLTQLCGALHEAHTIGLIHRDIKPGNVRVCERGGRHDVVKLLDFGLVLPLTDAGRDDKLTLEGTITGTPMYMSPEQAGGHQDLDARSDVYSVGTLAYFMLTGQPPFVRPSIVRTLAAHLYETPAGLRAQVPGLSAELEAVVLRCLAKNPGDRFADAKSLENALAACGTSTPWDAKDAAAWWRAHADVRPGRAAEAV